MSPPEPADKSALLFRYNNHLVCQVCRQTDIYLRVPKVADAIAETVSEVTNANQVACEESAVLRIWGKRMVEGSRKDTYSSKKAKFKGERSRFTIVKKLTILDETSQPNALQKDVLCKHRLTRSDFARWRKQEKEWSVQIKKDKTALSRKYKPKEDPLMRIRQALNTYILRTKSKHAKFAADPSDWWYHPVERS